MGNRTAKLIELPLDWYREMRAGPGIVFDPKFKSWNVFRYDDAQRILNDHGTFSSRPRGGPALPSIVYWS